MPPRVWTIVITQFISISGLNKCAKVSQIFVCLYYCSTSYENETHGIKFYCVAEPTRRSNQNVVYCIF